MLLDNRDVVGERIEMGIDMFKVGEIRERDDRIEKKRKLGRINCKLNRKRNKFNDGYRWLLCSCGVGKNNGTDRGKWKCSL